MRRIILIIVQIFLIGTVAFCQGDLDIEQFKFPLKSITTHCPDSFDLFSTILIKYDSNKHLMKILSFNNQSDTSTSDFHYNEKGLLVSKHSYSLPHTPQSDGMTVYKYDANKKLIYEGCTDEKTKCYKNTYSYNSSGQLVTSNGECNERHWKYSYEYNSQGKLSKKYENGGFDEITYEYFQNRLIKEVHNQRSGTVETTYDYDGDGLLLYKKENEKVIERNIYDNGQLVERLTYYFGSDLGFSPCNSQYISKFKYY